MKQNEIIMTLKDDMARKNYEILYVDTREVSMENIVVGKSK